MTESTAVMTLRPEDAPPQDESAAVAHSALRIEAYRLRDEVARRKLVMAAAGEISKSTWGSKLSEMAGVKLAEWCYGHGIDPLRHIYILGDKVYDAAEYYKDKLATLPNYDHREEIMIAPLILTDGYAPKDVELSDSQRAKLREKAQEENYKRLQLAMDYGVPPDIFTFPKNAAAFLVIIYWKDGTVSKGVNWAGSRGRTKGQQGGSYDPVGDGEPVKTARTRAFRVAAKDKVPFLFSRQGPDLDRPLLDLEDLIAQGREALKRGDAASPARLPPADVQSDLKVGAGSGGAVRVPAEPFVDKAPPPAEPVDAKLEPSPVAAQEPTTAELKQAASVNAEMDALKAELRGLLKHNSITDDDRRIVERQLSKDTITIPQVRQYIAIHQSRIADWEAGNAKE